MRSDWDSSAEGAGLAENESYVVQRFIKFANAHPAAISGEEEVNKLLLKLNNVGGNATRNIYSSLRVKMEGRINSVLEQASSNNTWLREPNKIIYSTAERGR
jgi:hypothetical protein